VDHLGRAQAGRHREQDRADAGRPHLIARVNAPFLAAGGAGDDFRAGIGRAVALGWLWRHESGITEFRDNTVFVLFE
jgi:hypothetical protein